MSANSGGASVRRVSEGVPSWVVDECENSGAASTPRPSWQQEQNRSLFSTVVDSLVDRGSVAPNSISQPGLSGEARPGRISEGVPSWVADECENRGAASTPRPSWQEQSPSLFSTVIDSLVGGSSVALTTISQLATSGEVRPRRISEGVPSWVADECENRGAASTPRPSWQEQNPSLFVAGVQSLAGASVPLGSSRSGDLADSQQQIFGEGKSHSSSEGVPSWVADKCESDKSGLLAPTPRSSWQDQNSSMLSTIVESMSRPSEAGGSATGNAATNSKFDPRKSWHEDDLQKVANALSSEIATTRLLWGQEEMPADGGWTAQALPFASPQPEQDALRSRPDHPVDGASSSDVAQSASNWRGGDIAHKGGDGGLSRSADQSMDCQSFSSESSTPCASSSNGEGVAPEIFALDGREQSQSDSLADAASDMLPIAAPLQTSVSIAREFRREKRMVSFADSVPSEKAERNDSFGPVDQSEASHESDIITDTDPLPISDVAKVVDVPIDMSVKDLVPADQVFIPVTSGGFEGGRVGFVFKTDNKGLGYYREGYRSKRKVLRAVQSGKLAWNNGPGAAAVCQAPLGPLPKPQYQPLDLKTVRHVLESGGDEVRSISYLRRMAAEVNSRKFSASLEKRENELHAKMSEVLQGMTKMDAFKKKTGYNLHGQRITSDGRSIVKHKPEITDEEIKRQPWYRKIYALRTAAAEGREELDAIEARREAMACSRDFMDGLAQHQKDLDKKLRESLRGTTTMDKFTTRDVGSYDILGKLILSEEDERERQRQVQIQATRRQAGEKGSTYVWQATERLRRAHEDIVEAIAKKSKELEKELRKTDQKVLECIAQDVVSFSMGQVSSQAKTQDDPASRGKRRWPPIYKGGLTVSPDQVRREFGQTLAQCVSAKEKEVYKAIMAKAPTREGGIDGLMREVDADVNLRPGSWRKDKHTVRVMSARRRRLRLEAKLQAKAVFSPWRPGGAHIAEGPWEPFFPRDRRPGGRRRRPSTAKRAHDSSVQGEPTRPHVKGSLGKARPASAPSSTVKRKQYKYPDCTPMEAFLGRITSKGRTMIRSHPRMAQTFGAYKTEPFPCHSPFRNADGSAVDDIDRLRAFSTASSAPTERRKRVPSSANLQSDRQRRTTASASTLKLHHSRTPTPPLGFRIPQPEQQHSPTPSLLADSDGECIVTLGGITLVDAHVIESRPRSAVPRPPAQRPLSGRGSYRRPHTADGARASNTGHPPMASDGGEVDLESSLRASTKHSRDVRHTVLQGYIDRRIAARQQEGRSISPRRVARTQGAEQGTATSSIEQPQFTSQQPFIASWDLLDTQELQNRTQSMEEELVKLYVAITDSTSSAIASSMVKARELLRELIHLLKLPSQSYQLLCGFDASSDQLVAAYVQLVSRLSTLWTICCGVPECAALVRKRESLLQVGGESPPSNECLHGISEHTAAVRESIHTWVNLVGRLFPWPVCVEWNGASYLDKMDAEDAARTPLPATTPEEDEHLGTTSEALSDCDAPTGVD